MVSRASDGGAFRVYVMLGEILAAHADDDDARLLVRIAANGSVGATDLEALRARVANGGTLGETLFDLLPEPVVLGLLYERFREDLLGFLQSESVESFQAMEAVFTDNIQVGHDSRALLDELAGVRARVATLRRQPEMVLAPGAAAAESEDERVILERCVGRVRLAELLVRCPAEPGRTLELVQGMLDRGTLLGVVPQSRRRAASPPVEAAPVEAAPVEAAPVEAAPVEAAPAPAEAIAEPEPTDPNGDDGSPTTADDLPDDPTVDEPLRSAFFQTESVEDDLAAFQDYDTSRGGGSFVTDRDLLDRVDLDVAPPEAPAAAGSVETIIEMEEADAKEAAKGAVSLNFSGPKLADDEIERKLEVTNEVLATIADAIEAVEGRGSGQARLQLLVEGTSVPLAPLFKNVELSNEGYLPVVQVMKNLRKRPAGEHRRLLNRGLSDLIERALSAAFESLDEAALETMLERIAGYQQRLGV